MNFFRSILSDDPDPPNPHKSEPNSPPNGPSDEENDVVNKAPNANRTPTSSADGGTSYTSSVGGWSFGGLIQTFATRSESVLETYRRDLQEFGSGLKKETEIFREVATRAVKDLPASIEVGASVAHGSLESVTQALDGVIKSTAEIISHGKESVISSSDVESETPDASRVSGSGRYSRFDAQLYAIQNDINTFCEEPEDLEEYDKWKLGFSLEEKSQEVENLIGENGVLEAAHKRVVPDVVDNETFWSRYFYRVYKLKQQEKVRANLVKRAISIDDEEELSWDVDDDDDDLPKLKGDELEKKALGEQISSPVPKQESASDEPQSPRAAAAVNVNEEDKSTADSVIEKNVAQLSEISISDDKAKLEESSQVKKEEKLVEDDEKLKNEDNLVRENEKAKNDRKLVEDDEIVKSEGKLVEEDEKAKNKEKLMEDDEKAGSEGKVDHGESGKDSDVSVVSSRQSVHEEEDMGWDEIEDIGSDDERKDNPTSQGGSSNRGDFRKGLSASEEDEDIGSWDIEDDD